DVLARNNLAGGRGLLLFLVLRGGVNDAGRLRLRGDGGLRRRGDGRGNGSHGRSNGEAADSRGEDQHFLEHVLCSLFWLAAQPSCGVTRHCASITAAPRQFGRRSFAVYACLICDLVGHSSVL